MSNSLAELPANEVGERLRIAREKANLTQAAAAAAVDIARTTLVAIEQGQRRVRIGELQQLAKAYGTSINSLLRIDSVHVDLAPRFRKVAGDNLPSVEAATQVLSDLVQAEVELENLLGIRRVRNYPTERVILAGDVRLQAEQDALEVRERLGLGQSPVLDIVTLLELQLGVRVYVRRLDSQISGLFAYEDSVGACILLNANHPKDRRNHTAAHELGHLVATRRQPEVLHDSTPENSKEERYANCFARAFLTPARAVMQKFEEVTAGATRLTRRHIVVLSHAFAVSREAMVKRLEELSLTKVGSWEWFQANGSITEDHVRLVLGDLVIGDDQKADADRPTTIKLELLATEAWRRGLLSEGQIARLLHLHRVQVREFLSEVDGGAAAADEGPILHS